MALFDRNRWHHHSEIANLELTEFHRNLFSCFTEGIPYAILMGKTKSKNLPENITVLPYCEDRTFEIGKTLTIIPIKDPTKKVSLNPLKLRKGMS